MRIVHQALVALAGLLGMAGVAAAAIAAHAADNPMFGIVAPILMIQATGVVAIVALSIVQGGRGALDLAATFIGIGAALFSAAVLLPSLSGIRLFPMAAPAGGIAMMGGWLLVSVAVLLGLARART